MDELVCVESAMSVSTVIRDCALRDPEGYIHFRELLEDENFTLTECSPENQAWIVGDLLFLKFGYKGDTIKQREQGRNLVKSLTRSGHINSLDVPYKDIVSKTHYKGWPVLNPLQEGKFDKQPKTISIVQGNHFRRVATSTRGERSFKLIDGLVFVFNVLTSNGTQVLKDKIQSLESEHTALKAIAEKVCFLCLYLNSYIFWKRIFLKKILVRV